MGHGMKHTQCQSDEWGELRDMRNDAEDWRQLSWMKQRTGGSGWAGLRGKNWWRKKIGNGRRHISTMETQKNQCKIVFNREKKKEMGNPDMIWLAK